MPLLKAEQIVPLAAALISLRDETLTAISAATAIRTANLSVWLRGKEQVISERRVVGLLHHLGLAGGCLRSDVVHLWRVVGSLAEFKKVLDLLLSAEQKAVLRIYTIEQYELQKVWFLRTGPMVIRVVLEPGLSGSPELNPQTLGYGRLVEASPSLLNLPTTSPHLVLGALRSIDDRAAISSGDYLFGLDPALEEELQALAAEPSDPAVCRYGQSGEFDALKAQLDRLLSGGMSADDIARLLAEH